MTFIGALKVAIAFGAVSVALALAFAINDILIMFLAAIIFAIALDKPIDKLVDRKVPRAIAAVAIYTIFLIFLVLAFFATIPPLAQEMKSFSIHYPTYIENLFGQERIQELDIDLKSSDASERLISLSDTLGTSPQSVVNTIMVIFGGFVSFLVIFFVSLFLNMQKDGVRHFLFMFVPTANFSYATRIFDKIQNRVGTWLWGKALSSLIVGTFVYLGLLLIGIPYAIALAVLAILLNFVPYAGPFVASIPAVLIGLAQSSLQAIAAAGLYAFVNGILESFIFIPLLMKKAIKMNPALLILFVLIGGRLGGVLGVVISIPVAAIMSLILEEHMSKASLENR